MLEALASGTHVVERTPLTPADLDRIVTVLVGPEAGVAVVCDPTPLAPRTALVEGLARLRDCALLDEVRVDPRSADVDAMARSIAGRRVDVVVAIGGGSTLDSGKGLAVVRDNGGPLADYLGPAPAARIERRQTRTVLVPTTAGTGSEVTRIGVFTAPSGRKFSLGHDALQPDVAILAPELTYTLPPAGTAATALDALCHALETLWNRNATPLSDELAPTAAVAVLESMERAWESARSGGTAGRAEILRAACIAGISFNMTQTAAIHALSFVLSEEWHVPHGAACAFFLPAVFGWNARVPAVRDKLRRVADRLGLADDDPVAALHERIARATERMGVPTTFPALGVTLPTERLLPLFEKTLADPKMANNLPSMSAADVATIVAACTPPTRNP